MQPSTSPDRPARNRSRILALALAGSVLVNVAFATYYTRSGGLRRTMLMLNLIEPPLHEADWQFDDMNRFKALAREPGGIVFAGDSLIAAGPWGDFYSSVHSRGIGGEKTSGLLARLGDITRTRPSQILLLTGSNDLSTSVPTSQILRNYRAILTKIRAESPQTRIVVFGILPVNRRFWPSYTPEAARDLSDRLRDLTSEFPGVVFADLAPQLANSQGELREEFTTDGLHLKFKAYLAIEDQVRALLAPGEQPGE